MEKTKPSNIKKKAGKVNSAIASMIQRQNLIDSSKSVEQEVKLIGNDSTLTEGKKNKGFERKDNIKDDTQKIINDNVQTEKKSGEEIAESDYESFFRVNEKYEGDKDSSVYIYNTLHYKLKNLVNAENRKNINMTVLLSNIVEDFFNKNDKKIKKALKKLSEL